MRVKHKLRTKGPKSKVRTRSMSQNLNGGTVRVLEGKDLPTGCCVIKNGGHPCTFRLSHIDVKVEKRWLPEEQEWEHVIKMLGYCKTHRPKTDRVLELPTDLERKVNGPKNQKSRIRRMEEAMYYEVVPQGGIVRHLTEREGLGVQVSGWVRQPFTTLCGKRMKQGYIPTLAETRTDYVKQCPKCQSEKQTVSE